MEHGHRYDAPPLTPAGLVPRDACPRPRLLECWNGERAVTTGRRSKDPGGRAPFMMRPACLCLWLTALSHLSQYGLADDKEDLSVIPVSRSSVLIRPPSKALQERGASIRRRQRGATPSHRVLTAPKLSTPAQVLEHWSGRKDKICKSAAGLRSFLRDRSSPTRWCSR